MSANPEQMPEPVFWTRRQVEARTSLKRSTLYARMAAGEFPRPISIGAGSVRWRIADVEAWCAERPPARPEDLTGADGDD